jgi:hypothetical protein
LSFSHETRDEDHEDPTAEEGFLTIRAAAQGTVHRFEVVPRRIDAATQNSIAV